MHLANKHFDITFLHQHYVLSIFINLSYTVTFSPSTEVETADNF